jgi:ferrochelatase
MSSEPSTGILCMAYGSPASEADIAAYYTHIRGGRPPSPEALAELTARYRAIDGSPLTQITRDQATALAERTGMQTFVGMKHAAPFIADGAAEARRAGIERLVGLPLAPHFANMSLGSYQRSLLDAWDRELVFVPGFHDHPAFISAVQTLLRDALAESRPERIFFTAHSLPARIIAEGISPSGNSPSSRRATRENRGSARTCSKRSKSQAAKTCWSARSVSSPIISRSSTTSTSRPRLTPATRA